MTVKDKNAIDSIINQLEKANDIASSMNIDAIVDELNSLKDSIDERLENVADYEGLSQTDANVEKQDASDSLEDIISNLETLQSNLDEIDNAIDNLRCLT